jgi:hypothetical protein
VPSVPPWRRIDMRGSIGRYPLLSHRLRMHAGQLTSAMHARRLTGLRWSLPLPPSIHSVRTISARQYGHTHKDVIRKADKDSASPLRNPIGGKTEVGPIYAPNTVTARERLSREEVCHLLPFLSFGSLSSLSLTAIYYITIHTTLW